MSQQPQSLPCILLGHHLDTDLPVQLVNAPLNIPHFLAAASATIAAKTEDGILLLLDEREILHPVRFTEVKGLPISIRPYTLAPGTPIHGFREAPSEAIVHGKASKLASYATARHKLHWMQGIFTAIDLRGLLRVREHANDGKSLPVFARGFEISTGDYVMFRNGPSFNPLLQLYQAREGMNGRPWDIHPVRFVDEADVTDNANISGLFHETLSPDVQTLFSARS